MVFLEDLLQATSAVSQARDARRGATAARAAHRAALRRRRSGPGCAGHHHLLERQHRRAEGRDADASQRAGEHRRRHRAVPADAGRRRARRAAVLPLLRLHRHALAAARRRLRRRLPSEPDRREDDRRARGDATAPRCSSARRPSAARTCARCLPEQFAHLRLAIVGAERLREPIAAAFKDKFGVELLEGLRLHRDGAGRRGERARRDGRSAGARRRGSVGRPLPGIAAMVVDPETGEGPLDRQGGAAARQRPEPDGRLPRRARADRSRRCATAGT